MNGIKINGIGKAVPKLCVTNEDLSRKLDTSDEWIYSRTGIHRRHVAQTETTTSLAIEAGRAALKSSGISKVDLVIVATSTADYAMPSTACEVAGALGIEEATCFDLTAACTGFIYASEVAISLMKANHYKHALVIGADVLSKVVDWKDRSTCVLFADGAGAVVYSQTEQNKIVACQTGSDGKGSQLITLPNSLASRLSEQPSYLQMDGRAVYRFATTKIPDNIKSLLESVHLEAKEVDWFILHQANARIMDSVAKKLEVDSKRFFKNLEEYGNTSAASIPMALYDVKEKLKPGDKIILSGFGAGLTWGSLLIEW